MQWATTGNLGVRRRVSPEGDQPRGFDNTLTLRIAVTPFLQHPTIAIRVREVGEARVVPVRGVEPDCETSVPGIDGDLVPDRTDFDPALKQAAPRGLEVGDDEIDVAK